MRHVRSSCSAASGHSGAVWPRGSEVDWTLTQARGERWSEGLFPALLSSSP